MKKLMIAAAIVCAAVMAQAATTQWKFSASNIIGSQNIAESLWTGTMDFVAVGIGSEGADLKVASGNVVDGKITLSETLFEDTEHFNTGDTYSFYLTATDANGNVFKSQTVQKMAGDALKAVNVAFGSQAGNTWTAAAPEPTSGLLLLLGVAGLALKRRRA